MSELRDILLKLCRREDLTRDEARDAFMFIMSGQATDAQIGGLLVGLASERSDGDHGEHYSQTTVRPKHGVGWRRDESNGAGG